MTPWTRLSVPCIAIISFVGCVGNIGLLKAIAQKWRQGGILCWLLFEVLLLNLIYLIQQSTLINLENLGLGLPSSTTFWLVRACVQLSLRASSLVLSLTLAFERYLIFRRPKIHGSIMKQCYCGRVLLAILLMTVFMAIAYIFAEYHGLVSAGLLSSVNIYAAKFTIIFQMTCAIFLLIAAVYLTCMTKRKRRTVGKRSSKTSHVLSPMLFNIRATQSLVWFFMTISLTTFSVCLMNVFTLGDIQMIQSADGFHEILSTVADWIDVIGYSVAPFSLLLSNKRLLRLAVPVQLILSDKNQEKGTPPVQDNASKIRPPKLIPRDGYLKGVNLTLDTEAPKFRKDNESGLPLSFRTRKRSKSRIVRSFRESEASSSSRQHSTSTIVQGGSSVHSCSVTTFFESQSSVKLSPQSTESNGLSFSTKLSICHTPEKEEDDSIMIGEEEFGCKISKGDNRSELSVLSSAPTIRVHSITTDQQPIFDAQNFIVLKSPISLSLPEESNVDTFFFPANPVTICWQAAEPLAKLSCASPYQDRCDLVKRFSPIKKDSDTFFVVQFERPGTCYANGGGPLHLPGFIPSPVLKTELKHKRTNSDSSFFVENASNVDFLRTVEIDVFDPISGVYVGSAKNNI